MPNEDDDRDEESADLLDQEMCIDAYRLQHLFMLTGERIDYDEHGHFVSV
jgi:hypothetical protein